MTSVLGGYTAICQGAARLEVLSKKAVNMKKPVHPAMKNEAAEQLCSKIY